ncbi:MAG: DEAD/DEAH box helicase [Bryobacteraceae bacterium]|jgi:DEAD/DEAH box helicase domain-containing protein
MHPGANLTLGLTESSDPFGVTRRSGGIETSVARFQQWMAVPDSPIRAIRHQPAREGEFAEIPAGVAAALRDSLAARGIPRLYVHQAEAFEQCSAGRNVVVVTPTASGKTLCYNLPVLQRLIDQPAARAMYLFPTKALAEDQLHEFQAAVDAMGSQIRAFTYDGDTPQDARRAIRERANVVLTNPDMLHSGILPHHTKWAKCFENLRYVVIDELHYYRGVYGSHLANVLRRLRRICEFYGSKPQFICCSATIANPKELAEALTEMPFELVDRNGAPSGEKYFVFYNPPVVNRQLGIRRGYLQETRRIAVEFIERHQQTLVFANSRLATEILVKYLRDAIEHGPLPGDAVRGYRGGYLPRERREIERKLRDGEIRAVVATNALELGVDIGSLDAVVMAGYPGSIASVWQRAGRAGRRQSASLAVMVASSAPLDQYVVEHPEYFFEGSPEHAHINADNLEILINHLKCAAFELPIRDGEKFGPHDPAELCRFLADDAGLLHRSGGCWHWTSDTYPADTVSLRSMSSDNFIVVDITGDHQVIAEVAFTAALTTLHEKAIYLHEARQFQVEKLDYEGRKAYVRRVDSDYFTDAIDYTQVKELEEFESEDINGARAAHGDVRVNTQVVGFKKLRFYSMENIGAGNLSMPEQELHTTAFWLHFPESFWTRCADLTPAERQSGLTGLGQVLRTVAALLLMCDPRDLGIAIGEDISRATQSFEPDLFLFDNYPGGIGQSQPLFQLKIKLLQGALEVLVGCGCQTGCPACVGPVGEVGETGKQATLRLLRELLQAQRTNS